MFLIKRAGMIVAIRSPGYFDTVFLWERSVECVFLLDSMHSNQNINEVTKNRIAGHLTAVCSPVKMVFVLVRTLS